MQSLLNFLPGAKAAPRAADGVQGPEGTLVTGVPNIVQLINSAIQYQNPVHILIPGERTPFFTFFDMESKVDKEAMAKGEYLLVAPLDPPKGNMKIRLNPQARLRFYTDSFIVDAKVIFDRFLDDKSIKLMFPKEVMRSPQKRSGVRVKVPGEWDLPLTVVRPSGLTAMGKIHDISTSGIAFHFLDDSAMLAETSRVGLVIYRPGASSIEVQAQVLGAVDKEGIRCYRARFLIKAYAVQEALEKLINYLLEKHTERRDHLFHR